MQTIRAWVPGTTIRLVTVNWDQQYRDVVEWESDAQRDQWFDDLPSTEYTQPQETYTYLRPFQPIDIGMPFNTVLDHNYIMVDNPPVDGDTKRRLYYFITSVEYLTPQTTRIRLQLDVWTTFSPTTRWGRSFVDRGHLGLANSNATSDPQSLREYQTVPEDLDVGDVLATSYQQAWPLFNDHLQRPGTSSGLMVMITCSVDLASDPGTIDAPNQHTALPTQPDHLLAGGSVFALTMEDWYTFMVGIRQYSWISRNIQTHYAVPMGFTDWEDEPSLQINSKYGSVSPKYPYMTWNQESFKQINVINQMLSDIPERYRIIKKLLTYPYSVIEMSGNDGNPVFYKPQLLTDETIDIQAFGNMVQPWAMLGFYIYGYGDNGAGGLNVVNKAPAGPTDGEVTATYSGDTFDSAVRFSNWPQFSTLNDMYINYLANTAYTRKFSYDAAGWSLQKGTAQLALQQQIGSSQLATNQANQDIQNDLTNRGRVADLVTGGVGIAGQLATGNIGGAIGSAVGAGAGLYKSIIGQQASNAQFANNQAQAGAVLDANQKYGAMAQQGDYQQAINAINSQVQQAQLTPPSTSGQAGGEGAALAIGSIVLRFQIKTMLPGILTMVGDYFLRYGIAIRRFLPMPTKLCCMTRFAYWRLSESYIISSDGDENVRDTLRGIMQKGVTVWKKPEYIGTTSLYDNQPESGYSY